MNETKMQEDTYDLGMDLPDLQSPAQDEDRQIKEALKFITDLPVQKSPSLSILSIYIQYLPLVTQIKDAL